MALPIRVARAVSGDAIERAQREFDSLLHRFFTPSSEMADFAGSFPVDVREDENHLIVDAELPGFKKDEVEVTLENGVLTISAERRSDRKQDGSGDYLLHERRWQRVQRSFNLPPTVAEQSVNAKLSDGVLTITLDKREETKPRKITVA